MICHGPFQLSGPPNVGNGTDSLIDSGIGVDVNRVRIGRDVTVAEVPEVSQRIAVGI